MTDKVLIAKVSSVFGIKGQVKIIIFSDDPLNLEKYELFNKDGDQLKIKINNKNKAVIGTSSGNPIVIAKIDGVETRNEAEDARGLEIFTNRVDFNELEDDEFYYIDLIGLDVVDENSKKIGKVIDIVDHGAGGIVEIKFSNKELIKELQGMDSFAFSDKLFPEVNLKKGFISFKAPEIITEKE